MQSTTSFCSSTILSKRKKIKEDGTDQQNDSRAVVSCLSVGEKVGVFCEGDWVKGTILAVLFEGSRYLVRIDGEEEVPIEVCRSHLRVLGDWVDWSWITPLDQVQKESFQTEVKDDGRQLEAEQESNTDAISKPRMMAEVRTDSNGKRVKLRIKYTKTIMETKFSPGTTVEVKSEEDGYKGSWYTATIVGSAGVGKFLVEYQTLKTEDETELLKEVANEQDIRPYPPEIPRSRRYRYKVLEDVDAWYNDGWWEGVVSEVLDDWKYIVYFASTNEKLVYQHSHLRPHRNWVDGKWVLASQHRPSDLYLRTPSSGRKCDRSKSGGNFGKGTMVEVRSDEPGYEGSWYSAVVRSKKNGRFLVEYMMLKTEDERKFLREEIEAQNIRPFPPEIEVGGCYRLLESVDAWYNDGWWTGVVSKVLDAGKCKVYFKTTGEELEFDHVNLRTHQEWVNGEWIAASKDLDLLS